MSVMLWLTIYKVRVEIEMIVRATLDSIIGTLWRTSESIQLCQYLSNFECLLSRFSEIV